MKDDSSQYFLDDETDEDIDAHVAARLASYGIGDSNLPSDETLTTRESSENSTADAQGPSNGHFQVADCFLDGMKLNAFAWHTPIEYFMSAAASRSLREYGIHSIGELTNIARRIILTAANIDASELERIEDKIKISCLELNDINEDIQSEKSSFRKSDGAIILPSGRSLDARLSNLDFATDLGLNLGFAGQLRHAGYETVGDLAGVPLETLLTLRGVGPGKIKRIKQAAANAGVPEEFWDLADGGLSEVPVTESKTMAGGEYGIAWQDFSAYVVMLSNGETLDSELCNLSIEKDLGLTASCSKKLRRAGFDKVSDLAGLSEEGLCKLPGLGKGTAATLVSNMSEKGVPESFWESGTQKISNNGFRSLLWDSLVDEVSVEKSLQQIVGSNYSPILSTTEVLSTTVQGNLKIQVNLFASKANIASLLDYSSGFFDQDDAFFADVFKNCSDCAQDLLELFFTNATNRTEAFKRVLCLSLGHVIQVVGFTQASELILDVLNAFKKSGIDCSVKAQQIALLEKCPEYIKQAPMEWFNILALDFEEISDCSFGELLDMARANPVYFALCEEGIDALNASQKLIAQAESYEQLISQMLVDCEPETTSRNIDITTQYLSRGREKITLQKIANQYGMTRERVRQIIKKCQRRLDFDKSLRYQAIRIASYAALKSASGIVGIKEGEALLAKNPFALSGSIVSVLAQDRDLFEISKSAIGLSMASIPCLCCKTCASVCDELRSSGKCMTEAEFMSAAECEQCSAAKKPFLSFIAGANSLVECNGIWGDRNSLVMQAKLKPDKPGTVLHAVLFEADKALTYDEMISEVQQRTGQKLSKNQVSYVGSYTDCMLWGRGTYIHERNAPWPEPLLEEIQARIFEEFRSRQIPILCVEGIFNLFENQLMVHGVPNKEALYSLLRKLNDSGLLLQEFPWICLAEEIDGRTSFAQYFYSVLEQNNGFITGEHARMIADRAMVSSSTLSNLAEYSKYLVHKSEGWYSTEEMISTPQNNRVSQYQHGAKQEGFDSDYTQMENLDSQKDLEIYKDGVLSILENEYRYGCRVDSVELKRFRNFAEKLDIALPEDDEALKRVIINCGVFIDGKIHVVQDETIDTFADIVNGLFADGGRILFFASMYERHKDYMEECCINSDVMLSSICSNYCERVFPKNTALNKRHTFITLDGKRKEKEAISTEIERVWGAASICSIDEISEKLPYIPFENLTRCISGNADFIKITAGVYFSMKKFVISQKEEKAIYEYVSERCAADGVAFIKDIPLGNIAEENFELKTPQLEEAIYNEVLRTDFKLEKRTIVPRDSDLSLDVLIKQYIEGKKECTFTEIKELFLEKAEYKNYRPTYRMLYENMTRVGKDRYVEDSLITFKVDEIDEILSEIIGDGFIAIKELKTFALFPECGQPWNHYLLESYCFKYSQDFQLMLFFGFNDENLGIIAEKGTSEDYVTLLAKAAAREPIELTAESVGNYFYEAGYTGHRKFRYLDGIVEEAKKLRGD